MFNARLLFALVSVTAGCAPSGSQTEPNLGQLIGQPTDGQPGLACLDSPVVEYLGLRSNLVCIWPCRDGQAVMISSVVSNGGFSSTVMIEAC
jgi:hypothetical protein